MRSLRAFITASQPSLLYLRGKKVLPHAPCRDETETKEKALSSRDKTSIPRKGKSEGVLCLQEASSKKVIGRG